MADMAVADRAYAGTNSRARCHPRMFAALVAACVPMYAAAAQPSQAPAAAARMAAHMTPIDWVKLEPPEQQVLAPLREQWAHLPPSQQQHLQRLAGRAQNAPAARREAIQQGLARWAVMTPEQRATVSSRYQEFRNLAPGQQQGLRDAYQRFGALPPEQRKVLRQRFETMTPAERAAFMAGAEAAQRNQGWQRIMADTPPAERAVTRAMWFALIPAERHALRHHLQPLSASERDDLRSRLLAMTPVQRSAFIAQLPDAKSPIQP